MTETPKIRASFDAKYLPMVAPFAAKNDIRYYLVGVCIQRAPAEHGGVYVIATNGHVLCVVHDRSGTIEGCDKVIIRCTPEMVAASKNAGRCKTKSCWTTSARSLHRTLI